MADQDSIAEFIAERDADINAMGEDQAVRQKSLDWMIHADRYKYTYNYTWMERPIIKFPNDMAIQQELMRRLKPDLVIEDHPMFKRITMYEGDFSGEGMVIGQ